MLSSCLFAILVLLLLPFPIPAPLLALPPCKNAVIFTGARQGSTWFVDSIENCAYSTVAHGDGARQFAKDVFKKTELWKHFGEKALDGVDMTAYGALDYIVSNTSIKIFPSVFWRRRPDIMTILNERKLYNLTVLVLRRDVEAAWDSWVRAESSNVWNGAVKTANVTFDESLHRYFVESRGRYDVGVEKLLNENGVEYDVFDYDKAKNMKTLVARNNGCMILNCNFRNAPAVDSSRHGGVDGDRSKDTDAAAAAGEDAADAPV